MDGNALDHGSVTFILQNAEGRMGAGVAGQIGADGTYSVQTGRSGGLESGEYAVKVSSREPSISQEGGAPPLPGELITPAAYSKTSTSGLRYNVRQGSNVIDIALRSDMEAPAEATEPVSEPVSEPAAEEAPVEEAAAEEADTHDSDAEGSETKDEGSETKADVSDAEAAPAEGA